MKALHEHEFMKLREKVREVLKRAKDDPQLRKQLQDHPLTTLLNAGIGFIDAEQVYQYVFGHKPYLALRDCDAGMSCLDPPETNH